MLVKNNYSQHPTFNLKKEHLFLTFRMNLVNIYFSAARVASEFELLYYWEISKGRKLCQKFAGF